MVFGLLAEIRPKNKAEAIAVFHYLAENDYMDSSGTEVIMLNLIGR